MGFFDKFKKNKKQPVKKTGRTTKVKTLSTGDGKIAKKEFSEAYRILRRPAITEKAFDLSGRLNQYVFEIGDRATKNEVKKAVRDLYGVRVIKVNILNVMGKKRRVGRYIGFRPGRKKAIVFLPTEEKIEAIAR